MTASDGLLVDVEGAVAWLTFDNPARRNALTLAMSGATVEAMRAAETDPAIRVVVLRGAGEEAFMSGADVGEQGDPARAEAVRAGVQGMLGAIGAASKPVIAMVRGWCLGGGLAAALQADLRVAAAGSVFGIPAARLGIAYPYAQVERLVALVGPAVAADLLYTGRRMTVEEAARNGLVQHVHPAAQLRERVAELAATIADNAPLTVRAAKAAIRTAQADPRERDLDAIAALVAACRSSQDYEEGRRAFFEKRSPRFRGR